MTEFNIDTSKDLKRLGKDDELFKYARINITSFNDPKLISSLEYVIEYNKGLLSNFDKLKSNDELKNSVYNDLISIVNAYSNTQFRDPDLYFEDEETLDSFWKWQGLFKEIFKQTILFMINDPLDKTLRKFVNLVFDPKSKIYELFKDSRSKFEICHEHKEEEWRKKLKHGDRIDAVIVSPKCGSKEWAPAIVSFVYNDTIEVKFENAPESFDRAYYRFSPFIDKAGKHLSCYQWKQDLKENDEIYKIDNSLRFRYCTILKRTEEEQKGRIFAKLKIAFRIYRENGKYEDKIGKYFGMDSIYDKDIPLMNPRISCLLKNVKNYDPKTSSSDILLFTDIFAGSEVVPSTDFIAGPEVDEDMISKYAFAKPGLRMPYLLTEALTYFEKQEGFKKILEYVTKKFMSIDSEDRYYCFEWTRKFLSIYRPKFYENEVLTITQVMKNAFEELMKPDLSISDKQDLEYFIENLIKILGKVDPGMQEQIQSEDLYYKICSLFLNYPDAKLSEDKWIDYIKALDPSGGPEINCMSVVYDDCIAKYQILRNIFERNSKEIVTNKHRSITLSFMISNNCVTEEEYIMFYNILSSMNEFLCNISLDFSKEIKSMDPECRMLLLKHFEECKFDPQKPLDFHFYCELNRYQFSDSENYNSNIQYLWKCIFGNTLENITFTSLNLCEMTKWMISHFAKLVVCKEELAMSYAKQCVVNLNSKEPKANSVCILRYILKMLSKTASNNSDPIKKQVQDTTENVDDLKSEEGAIQNTKFTDILENLIENEGLIKSVYNSLEVRGTNDDFLSLDVKDKIWDRYISKEEKVHRVSISSHLKLLALIAKNSSFELTKRHLIKIYCILFEKCEFIDHKVIFHKWLKKLSTIEQAENEIFDKDQVNSYIQKLEEE